MTALDVSGVGVKFGAVEAVKPIDLALTPGELIALVGPNGAGKTTLLKAIGGLVRCSGTVRIDGTDVKRMRPRQRARALSYLPQGALAHWPVTVAELVTLGRLPHRGFGEALDAEDQAAVARAMQLADVATLAHRSVRKLSGGERARALLARALAVEAPILLADEPTAALDPYHQLEIMEVLADYAQRPALVIAVLHDLPLAARFCNRLILLNGGSLVADGQPTDVLTPEVLERCYRIEAFRADHEDQPVVLPWRRRAKQQDSS